MLRVAQTHMQGAAGWGCGAMVCIIQQPPDASAVHAPIAAVCLSLLFADAHAYACTCLLVSQQEMRHSDPRFCGSSQTMYIFLSPQR